MNPLSPITRPIHHLWRAVTLPFTALFVVGLCAFINYATSPGHWWFKWVAFGMGIAVLVAWARALRVLAGLALVAVVGLWVHRRYGDVARAKFDEWVQRTQPQRSELLSLLRPGASTPL